jgi:hypothetical protein
MQQRRRIVTLAVAGVIATGFTSHAAIAGTPEAQKWVDSEFQPSTLSKQQQMDEMKWFIDTAATLKSAGVKEVHVVSETLDTHMYESKTLPRRSPKSPAFQSSTTSFRKATLSKNCRRRCNPARAFTTAGFPTPT